MDHYKEYRTVHSCLEALRSQFKPAEWKRYIDDQYYGYRSNDGLPFEVKSAVGRLRSRVIAYRAAQQALPPKQSFRITTPNNVTAHIPISLRNADISFDSGWEKYYASLDRMAPCWSQRKTHKSLTACLPNHWFYMYGRKHIGYIYTSKTRPNLLIATRIAHLDDEQWDNLLDECENQGLDGANVILKRAKYLPLTFHKQSDTTNHIDGYIAMIEDQTPPPAFLNLCGLGPDPIKAVKNVADRLRNRVAAKIH